MVCHAMAAVVYLVRDLLFVSKIRETAEQLGIELAPARTPEAVQAAARAARLVILDLRLPAALTALELLASDPATAAVETVGFVDHERLDVMETAKALGMRTVMAKGEFATKLPRLLGSLATPA